MCAGSSSTGLKQSQVGRTGGQEELKGLHLAMVKIVILAELEGPATPAPGAGHPLPAELHPWEVIWEPAHFSHVSNGS